MRMNEESKVLFEGRYAFRGNANTNLKLNNPLHEIGDVQTPNPPPTIKGLGFKVTIS
jgi:hypothetical protein